MPSQNIFNLLIRLWNQFDFRRKKQFISLLALIIFTSFAELITIGAIFPFLGALMNPENIFKLPNLQWVFSLLNINNKDQILLPLSLFFITSAILACLLRLFQLKVSLHISFAAGADIGFAIYKRALYQPYKIHLSRNSSEVIDGIATKTTAVTDGIIMSSLYIISSAILLGLLLFSLAFIAPLETIVTFAIFGGFYALITAITKKQQLANSREIAKESTKVVKSLQEGLGGIREVLLNGTQEVYCNIYLESDSLLRKAYASSSFISASPRFIIEAVGIVAIAGIAVLFSQFEGGISKAIPLIGSIALAAQRMLPIMQLSYGGWSNIRRYQYTLIDTLNLLEENFFGQHETFQVSKVSFVDSIQLKNISFKFNENGNQIINNICLEIPKRSRIGIIGTTGSGKTTLLDIVMGLLAPSSGTLLVDGIVIDQSNTKAWQKRISHVPQNIFLTDSSIEENIAFGVPRSLIDKEKVRAAASQAQLLETIEKLTDGMATVVGERGIKLSGGQKQRIGIARALYKDADVIILDEATSALDHKTEQKVMKAIDRLSPNVTVLIITHRISTLENCSKIIELENGEIVNIFNYSEIFKKYLMKKGLMAS